ncbi:peptidylprolyl isomerase [Candidatus Arthromitus sp. SFB-mouse-Japan]|uniref:peptidyl-prolyl cis-trans isomerase n=1 Tax=Candidatus Arthromitus sp. SFB-mouse TaxID=49118 RepID=UPI00021B8183|nr:peptidyl-prolyl cis-trans isomerase [Candidatus Arthromitus sp. SFB-mouse]EIA22182.1 Putative peptidyl-prolyl cis-trans isomerase [Candidatus Arthromitus sp. SFB-1]EIA22440.1 Putative peptidyl-prolyl cis-trans isomerase [Candidatus Arthromitus sp. SFB-2]EIA27695.1 Putative peptidyl-prolyl cis-trans isomerase [Candidatus Arthromitus sp. SFB-co]EIA29697.1 Putative peptidyl-prolyl cis-trans isomerase [Candidatus Arthromitus sp. SFB-mouse-SU]EIA31763.1 Putative peptidyl-prolyl cis-trans isomera
MKFNKILSRVCISLSILFTVSSCSTIEKTEEAIRKEVLATYEGRKITRGEVEDYFAGFHNALVQRYGENYKNDAGYLNDQLKAFAENYSQNSILIEEFDKRGLISEEEINNKVEESLHAVKDLFIDEENGVDDGHGHKIDQERFNKALNEAFYVDEEDYKNKQRDIIKINALVDDLIKDVSVTEEELNKYYEDNKDTKYITRPGAIMYHILVDTEEEALKVKERLNNGEKYEDIAKELNKDATSQTGGSLGFVEYDNTNYDADFLAGAKNLKEGEISDPVKTQFGYHIIKVTDVRTEDQYTDFESVKSEIEETLLYEKKNKAVTEFSENLFKEKKLKVK